MVSSCQESSYPASMVHIEAPANTDMFQFGWNVGFQNGQQDQTFDQDNTALVQVVDVVLYGSGYRAGYDAGMKHRLHRETAYKLLALNIERQLAEDRRQAFRQSPLGFVLWLISAPFTQTAKFLNTWL